MNGVKKHLGTYFLRTCPETKAPKTFADIQQQSRRFLKKFLSSILGILESCFKHEIFADVNGQGVQRLPQSQNLYTKISKKDYLSNSIADLLFSLFILVSSPVLLPGRSVSEINQSSNQSININFSTIFTIFLHL